MDVVGTRCVDEALMITTIEECQEAMDEIYGGGMTVYNNGSPIDNICGCRLECGVPYFLSCAYGAGNLNQDSSPICRTPPEPTPAPTAAPTAAPEPPAANGGGGTY